MIVVVVVVLSIICIIALWHIAHLAEYNEIIMSHSAPDGTIVHDETRKVR